MARRRWYHRFTRKRVTYVDDAGRERTEGGFLVDKQFGDDDFRRDFTRQPGWGARNDPWWGFLTPGGVYDCGRYGSPMLMERMHTDPRYTRYAGHAVSNYDGPYLTRGAVRWFGKRGVSVPEWAQMRSASHSDQRIQYPGYGGSTPEGYGGTFSWRKGYRPHRKAR